MPAMFKETGIRKDEAIVEHFMIMYAPPIVVAISLLFLFLWAPRTKDVTDEPENEQGRRMR
ncbi:hypothetical protein SAMN02799616_04662 [Paenibacillus sp. UNC499MF]|nr:hypothetical protein SAMN02799616_04662 [Paenibacillus sp. UNC499MF]